MRWGKAFERKEMSSYPKRIFNLQQINKTKSDKPLTNRSSMKIIPLIVTTLLSTGSAVQVHDKANLRSKTSNEQLLGRSSFVSFKDCDMRYCKSSINPSMKSCGNLLCKGCGNCMVARALDQCCEGGMCDSSALVCVKEMTDACSGSWSLKTHGFLLHKFEEKQTECEEKLRGSLGSSTCATRYYYPDLKSDRDGNEWYFSAHKTKDPYATRGFCADPENMYPKNTTETLEYDTLCNDTYGLPNKRVRYVGKHKGNVLTQQFGDTNGNGWTSVMSPGDELLYCTNACLVEDLNAKETARFEECWRLPKQALRSGCRTYSGEWVCSEEEKVSNADFRESCYADPLKWDDYTGPKMGQKHDFSDLPRCDSPLRKSSRMENTFSFTTIDAQKDHEGRADPIGTGEGAWAKSGTNLASTAVAVYGVYKRVGSKILNSIGPLGSVFSAVLDFLTPDPIPLSQQFEELVTDMKLHTETKIAEQTIKTYTESVEAFERKVYRMICIEKSDSGGACTTHYQTFERMFTHFKNTSNEKVHECSAECKAHADGKGGTEDAWSATCELKECESCTPYCSKLLEWETSEASVVARAAIRAKESLQDVTNEITNELEGLVSQFENTFEQVDGIGLVHTTRLASLNHVPILEKLGNVMKLFLASHECLTLLRNVYAIFSIDWESNYRVPGGGPTLHISFEYLFYKLRTMHELHFMITLAKRLMKASLRVRLNNVWMRTLHRRLKRAWNKQDVPMKNFVVHDTCQMDETFASSEKKKTITHGEQNVDTFDYKTTDAYVHKTADLHPALVSCWTYIPFKTYGEDLCNYFLSEYVGAHGSGKSTYSFLKTLVSRQGSLTAPVPGYAYLKAMDGGTWKGEIWPNKAVASMYEKIAPYNWDEYGKEEAMFGTPYRSAGRPKFGEERAYLCAVSYMLMTEERWWEVMNGYIPLDRISQSFNEARNDGHKFFPDLERLRDPQTTFSCSSAKDLRTCRSLEYRKSCIFFQKECIAKTSFPTRIPTQFPSRRPTNEPTAFSCDALKRTACLYLKNKKRGCVWTGTSCKVFSPTAFPTAKPTSMPTPIVCEDDKSLWRCHRTSNQRKCVWVDRKCQELTDCSVISTKQLCSKYKTKCSFVGGECISASQFFPLNPIDDSTESTFEFD